MKFLVLLTALLIEQVRPLRQGNRVHAAYARFAQYLPQQFDAGEYRQGVVAWLLAVAPLTLLVFVAEWLLSSNNSTLAWLFSAGVLYVAVGFRQFSNFFNKINSLLNSGELAAAREQLRLWRNEDAGELDANGVARVAIELGLIHSHRNVFGPVAWFLVFGPAGALMYRMAAIVRTQWYARIAPESGASDEFARFSARAFQIIDWVPARLTAASFAAAGNFQDAVDCWRSQASAWADHAQGIILASGAGALGVKLGGELHEYGRVRYRPDLGTGDDADADYLSSAVGLIWRTMVVWMLLLAVVTVARLLG
jgi:adenosylcobinamide-phosphate synthase